MPPLAFLKKPEAKYAPVEAENYLGLEHDGLDQRDPLNGQTNSPQRGRRTTRLSRTGSRQSGPSSNWSEIGYPPSSASNTPDSRNAVRRVARDATPLNHPSPGLQTAKGAYTSNISRLEDSAAKMSLSMDIEAELQKLREEQKQAEGSRRLSLQNSIQNSRPGSWAASGQLRLNDLPSPSAYIPISSETPFATSPVRSRHGSLAGSQASGPLSQPEGSSGPPSQPPQTGNLSRRSSAYALQSPPLGLQTVFEDAGKNIASKEMARGPSKASNAYSESLYSPEGGLGMRRQDSQAYSESMYSADKSPMDQPTKPLPLRTAYGQVTSPSNHAPDLVPMRTVYGQTSPSSRAPEPMPTRTAYGQAMSPSDHAPEAVTYQAYQPTPGAIQLVHNQDDANRGSYVNALPRRRGSAGSMDTYQQAATAFRDFDGAHIGHHGEGSEEEEARIVDEMVRDARRGSTMTIRQAETDPSSLALLSPSPDAAGSDKRVSFDPTTPSPEPDTGKRRSVLSMTPELDSKRKSTMTLGPARPQTPPSGHVYYPAPIPAMLSLPPKLAKGPSAADIQRKKGNFVAQARQSALRPGMFEPSGDPRASTVELDPHLKASLFFDHKPINNYELKLIDGSANKTLDAILDAAATAPLGAFTDHPYAGVLGPEVYGPPEPPKKAGDEAKRTSSADLLSPHRRQSSQPLSRRSAGGSAMSLGHSEEEAARASTEGTPLTHPAGEDGEYLEGEPEDEGPDANNFQGEHPDYIPIDTARPTTLLAELQLRKAENKHRTRTAATAFPNGMHSTLLQLDAVAQHQAKARRGKQIRLAWEDPNELARDEDEDVPLGMLVPHARRPIHDLLPPVPQARSPSFIDENHESITPDFEEEKEETLGERKARLALEAEKKRFTLNLDGLEEDGKGKAEDEDEPLAARRARLHRRKSSEFTSELMSQLGALSVEEEQSKLPSLENSPAKKPPPARRKKSLSSMAALAPKQPQGEETLGQRRRRLQAQQAAKEDAERLHARVKSRNSSMDLLGGEPGPAVITHHADSSMNSLPTMFQNNSNPGFAPPHSPTHQQPPFCGPVGMHMPMPIGMSMPVPAQMSPGMMPGVMPAAAFGYAPPPMPVPVAQQMQASNPGQPAQPLGLLGAHVMQQQQQQRFPPQQYVQSRGPPRPRSMMPQMNAQQISPLQPADPGRNNMVDRWRQGVAG